MLKNYPATNLFLIFFLMFVVLLFISPVIGAWNVYFEIVLDIFTFITKIASVFFFVFASVELIGSIHFRKHIH
jgi:hypothetical protein